jgi:hypothetical protein
MAMAMAMDQWTEVITDNALTVLFMLVIGLAITIIEGAMGDSMVITIIDTRECSIQQKILEQMQRLRLKPRVMPMSLLSGKVVMHPCLFRIWKRPRLRVCRHVLRKKLTRGYV